MGFRKQGRGSFTTYTHDGANRLTKRAYINNIYDAFTYDLASRLTQATSIRYNNWVKRFYDAAGRMTSETLTFPTGMLVGTTLSSITRTVGYQYDNDNRLTQVTYP
ncbi:MAG: hypothetical protein AAB263_13060, partial [Planctomycetota bacterium]